MIELRIRLSQPEIPFSVPRAAVASISRLPSANPESESTLVSDFAESTSDGPPSGGIVSEIPIPGGTTDSYAAFKVTPGRYAISAHLPSGERILKEVEVGDLTGPALIVEISPQRSVKDNLLEAWDSFRVDRPWALKGERLVAALKQHGLVEAVGDWGGQTIPEPERGSFFKFAAQALSGTSGRTLTRAAAEFVKSLVDDKVEVWRIRSPSRALSSAPPPPPRVAKPGRFSAQTAWDVLLKMTQAPVVSSYSALVKESGHTALGRIAREREPPVFIDDRGQLYVYKFTSSAPTMQNYERSYALVSGRETLELVVLPSPWLSYDSEDARALELTVDARATTTSFRTATAVDDPFVNPALEAFLRGTPRLAQNLIDSAKVLLHGRSRNPFAACVGAFVLMSATADDQIAKSVPWETWISELCDEYPWLPEAPILQARRLLRFRRTSSDVAHAAALYRQAYYRGLPFLTVAFQWLDTGFTAVRGVSKEVDALASRVAMLAARLNLEQPFTTVRLEPSSVWSE